LPPVLGYNKNVSFLFDPFAFHQKYSTNREAGIMFDKTMTFSVNEDREAELKKNLTIIYDALTQKGYNPVNQIVGYILSEDPTYITTYNNARSLIRHIDRDELLQVLVRSYLNA
jgi:uncharacterized protein (UPF0297 family)